MSDVQQIAPLTTNDSLDPMADYRSMFDQVAASVGVPATLFSVSSLPVRTGSELRSRIYRAWNIKQQMTALNAARNLVFAHYYGKPHGEEMSDTNCPCFGDYAGWRFYAEGRSEPYVYHHRVPQLYQPLTDIAPLLVSLSSVELPTTWERLYSHVRIPDPRRPTGPAQGPRFSAAPPHDSVGRMTVPPHTGVVDRFDLLVWTFWDKLLYGGYARSKGGRAISVADNQPVGGLGRYRAGAAQVWTIQQTTAGVLIGLVAYDEFGHPAPYWNIEPVPAAELIDRVAATSRIDSLARL